MFSGVLLTIKMALGSPFHYSPHWNRPSNTSGNDELADGLPGAFTKSNNSPASIFGASTRAPVFVDPSTNNKLFKQFMQTYLEDCRALLASMEQEDIAGRPFKAQNLNL